MIRPLTDDGSSWWDHDVVNTADELPPSGFQIASADEDPIEHVWDYERVWNPEFSKIFTEQISRFLAASQMKPLPIPDFTNTLYHPTMPHEIRVLRLAPGSPEQPLVAFMKHISVEFEFQKSGSRPRLTHFGLSISKKMKVPYTAVSYCWGGGPCVHSVVVSGHELMVTKTLDELLRRLRGTDKSVTIWVDQLCINQASKSDKDSQVKLMGQIYSRARNTVIWLGKEPGKQAFKTLRLLSRGTWAPFRDQLDHEELENMRHPVNDDGEGMSALRALFRQPWFQRTWILQEAVLSGNAYLMAGHDTIPWRDFDTDCNAIAGLGIFDDETDTRLNKASGRRHGLAVAAEIGSLRDECFYDGTSLLRGLVTTRYAAVTDPVDKVYGILGLCHDHNIVPDYNKTKDQLYCEVAAKIIRGDYSLLYCVDHDTDPFKSTLPSWVPDWSQPRLTTTFGYSTFCRSYYPPPEKIVLPNVSLSDTALTLSVTAIPDSIITQLSESFTDVELVLEKSPASNPGLRKCIDFFSLQSSDQLPDLGGHGLWHTFCSTLVAGKDDRGMNKNPEAYNEILSLLWDTVTGRSPTFADQIYTARQQKPIGRGGLTLEHFKKGDRGRVFQSLNKAFQNALLNRRLCWTSTGYMALVPRYTRKDDTIFRFLGFTVPFVLRLVEGNKYILVGECYALPLMDRRSGKQPHPQEYGRIEIV